MSGVAIWQSSPVQVEAFTVVDILKVVDDHIDSLKQPRSAIVFAVPTLAAE